jgi:DNA polymerase III alpha subunit
VSESKFLDGVTTEERAEYDEQSDYAQFLLEKGWKRWLNPEFRKGKALGHGRAIYSEVLARSVELGASVECPWRDENEYRERLEFEFDLIYRAGFIRYFLIVADVCRHAIEQDIPFQARGSANASLVAYLLGITVLDPLRHELLFFRFLNEDRVETGQLPDIDLDFADDRTEEIFAYLREKYGHEHVMRIGTHTRFRGALALQDVARAFEVPYADTLAITPHLIDAAKGDERYDHRIEDSLSVPCVAEYAARYPEVIRHAMQLEGQVRGSGVHAAGVVISPVPLPDVIPIARRNDHGKTGGTLATAIEMGEVEAAGFVKMDVLGLRTLRIVRQVFGLVHERHDPKWCGCEGCQRVVEIEANVELTENNHYHFCRKIPLEDPAVMQMLSEGHCYGLMQLETSGMSRLVKKMRPTRFSEVADANALYRPGALHAGAVDKYLRRLHGEERVPKVHPIYDRITAYTYGVMAHQEQLVQIVHDLGGFSWTEAGKLQKIVAKSKGAEQFLKFMPQFIEGAEQNGCSHDLAEAIFRSLAQSGSYLFNKAHSDAYTRLAIQQAFFKTYYPAEFLCSSLNSTQRMDKVYGFCREARRLNIPVKPPDVNASKERFAIRGEGESLHLRAGFETIKGVGPKAAAAIVRGQNEGVVFTDLENFLGRVEKRTVNKTVVKTLVDATAFESLHPNTWYLSTVLENESYPLTSKKRTIADLKLIQEHLEKAGAKTFVPTNLHINQKMKLMSFGGTRDWRIQNQARLLTIPPDESLLSCYDHVWNRIHKDHQFISLDQIREDRDYPSLLVKAVVTALKTDFQQSDDDEDRSKYQSAAMMALEDEKDWSSATVSPLVFERIKNVIEKSEGKAVVVRASKRANQDRLEIIDCALLDEFFGAFPHYLSQSPFRIDDTFKSHWKLLTLNEIDQDWTRYSDKTVRVCGVIDSVEFREGANGNRFANATITYDGVATRLTIWSDVLEKCEPHLMYASEIAVRGQVKPPNRWNTNWQIELSGRRKDCVVPLEVLQKEMENVDS